VIEGAKKEGVLSAKLVPALTEKTMYRLEREIKQKFGVDLKIKFTPVENMPKDVSEAIMEQKAGVIPSYDLMTFSNHVSTANKAGILERVDWKPLILEGTNPRVIHDSPVMYGAIVTHTGHFGMIYNPEKVKADEVPRSLADLAHPKWKGKGGVANYPTSWVRWCFMLGKEKVLSGLRAALKNGAIQGTYHDLRNRYLLGETSWYLTSSAYYVTVREKGMPAKWQSLDLSDITDFAVAVRKGARNSNAAKLVAVFLASPEGSKFLDEEGGLGSLYYPGNAEHDIRLQDQKQGVRENFAERNAELLEFYATKEAEQMGKEIQLLFQTGGER
jgi:ABC-type thiamine transport system substrate-binding protein